MSTYLDGSVRRATANTVTAMKQSARNRQCPKCKRKSALNRHSDGGYTTTYCRWPDCDYERTRSIYDGITTAQLIANDAKELPSHPSAKITP